MSELATVTGVTFPAPSVAVDREPPPPVVRVAGLPTTSLAALQFPETEAALARATADADWLDNRRTWLADQLHAAIGQLRQPELKPALIGLRRAVHRLRRPGRREWDCQVRSALPSALAHDVDEFLTRLQRWRQRDRELERTVAEEAESRTRDLLRIASDPTFRRALWQSSTDLSHELDKWLARPERAPRRQVIARLAKYVARAAAKTSPYSTFTASGFAAWHDQPAAVHLDPRWRPHGVLELHEGIRRRLVRRACQGPGLRPTARVTLNSSLTVRDTTVSFLGPPPAEPIVTLPRNAALDLCVARLSGARSLPLTALCDELVRSSDVDGPRVAAFLDHLEAAGMLVTRPPFDQPGELADLADWLASEAGDTAAGARQVRRLAVQLRTPAPVDEPDAHRASYESTHRAVAAVAAVFGTPAPDRVRPSHIIDSAVLTGTAARCGRAAWWPVLTELELIRRWLAMFDPVRPLQLALAELWRSWYPLEAQVSFLDLHRRVQEHLAGGADTAAELQTLLTTPATGLARDTSAFAAVRQLGELQRAALASITATGESARTVRIAPDVLRRQADDLPAWLPVPTSLGYYVQVCPPPHGALRVVINAVDTGHGRGRSRVAHLIGLAGGTPPDPVTRRTGGPILAELSGTYDSTYNRRRASLPYEIEYPFTESARPAAERLPLGDLRVGYDPGTDTLALHSVRLARQVTPIHLGMLAHPLLPPAARLLSRGFGEASMIRPDLILLGATEPVPAGQVRRFPRIMTDAVVLRRETWIVEAALVPVRKPGESDGRYLLRLHRWREAAGIPRRCFVRLLPPGIGHRSEALVTRKARKPVYIDFGSGLLVAGLENMLRGPVGVAVFEEALPHPLDAEQLTGAPRVTELLIETPGGYGAGD